MVYRAAILLGAECIQVQMLKTQSACFPIIGSWVHNALNVSAFQQQQLSSFHRVSQAAGSGAGLCACAFHLHLNAGVSYIGAKWPVCIKRDAPIDGCWKQVHKNTMPVEGKRKLFGTIALNIVRWVVLDFFYEFVLVWLNVLFFSIGKKDLSYLMHILSL